MRVKKSELLFKKSQDIFTGGVNSPVRSFKGVGGTPRFITRGLGPYVWDADGYRLIDFCGSWGASVFGHAVTALTSAIAGRGFCARVGEAKAHRASPANRLIRGRMSSLLECVGLTVGVLYLAQPYRQGWPPTLPR